MDKGGFRTVIRNESYSALEAVVYCKDCRYGIAHGDEIECKAHEEISYDPEPWHKSNWFCADGEMKNDA